MKKTSEKLTSILIIEMGLNIIAQDLLNRVHTEQDIKDYINEFKLEDA
jgi:hypothetical protein